MTSKALRSVVFLLRRPLRLSFVVTMLAGAALVALGTPAMASEAAMCDVFEGVIERLPSAGLIGDWLVSSKVVHVDATTRIDQTAGAVKLEARVYVKGEKLADGSFKAILIAVKPSTPTLVELKGAIQKLPETGLVGDWQVAGKVVHVTQETRIDQTAGPAKIGATVVVLGEKQSDCSIKAKTVVVSTSPIRVIEFVGTIDKLPASGLIGVWTVGGRIVHVDQETRIDQSQCPATIGALAHVRGEKQTNGTINALSIVVKPAPIQHIELIGTIKALPTGGTLIGDWLVLGAAVWDSRPATELVVHVDTTTTIDQSQGNAAVGARVVVKGEKLPDGTVKAASINVLRKEEPHEVEIVGQVTALPAGSSLIGDWLVRPGAAVETATAGGREVVVHVSAETTIDQSQGKAEVGARVTIKGEALSDGTVRAVSIVVLKKHEPPEVEVLGQVMKLPDGDSLVGDWTLRLGSGMTLATAGTPEIVVHVGSDTTIDQTRGKVVVGATVLVKGTRADDRTINARWIVVKTVPNDDDDRPTKSSFAVLMLERTANAPENAAGVVVTRQFLYANADAREDIKVAVEKLLPSTTYDIVIDATHAGAILTDAGGCGHLFLSSEGIPGTEPLPTPLRPVTERKRIEVIASGNLVVLVGDFANARRHGSDFPRSDSTSVAVLTGANPTTLGAVTAAVRGERQLLLLLATGLQANTTHSLIIDGVLVGFVDSDTAGRAHAVFADPPQPGELELPAALQPVSGLLHAELSVNDSVVVSGDFVRIGGNNGVVRRGLGH
jgi:hypothetical protein